MHVFDKNIHWFVGHMLMIITNTLLCKSMVHQRYISSAPEIDIDTEHLREYPYCGAMREPSSEAEGRAVNSKESTKDYRWVILITRINVFNGGKDKTSHCTGSIITDR